MKRYIRWIATLLAFLLPMALASPTFAQKGIGLFHNFSFSLSADHNRRTPRHNGSAVGRQVALSGRRHAPDQNSGRPFDDTVRRTGAGSHTAHTGRRHAPDQDHWFAGGYHRSADVGRQVGINHRTRMHIVNPCGGGHN